MNILQQLEKALRAGPGGSAVFNDVVTLIIELVAKVKIGDLTEDQADKMAELSEKFQRTHKLVEDASRSKRFVKEHEGFRTPTNNDEDNP